MRAGAERLAGVTVSTGSDVYYDPYDVDLNADPYPMFRRIREEAPLYFNERHGFYALSRYHDVDAAYHDHETFSSARGAVLEIIQSGMEIPPGTLIFEDPPIHNIHRKLLSRIFTPRKVAALEPKIREFTARCLDPLIGAGRFDFVRDLGAPMPMKVIGMLLGNPESDQQHVVEHGDSTLRTERGGKMTQNPDGVIATGEVFSSYIDWRAEHPSDDIMTEMLTAAIEELLRFEPPAPHVSRYVTRDLEYYGQTVPEGNAMMLIVGAANRDPRRFGDDSEAFNVHREPHQHLAFRVGTHFCLGNALARLEGRIALDEILDRFPEWEVDLTEAELSPTSTVRGWESMPAVVS